MFFMQGDEGQVGEGCEVDRTKRIFIDSITQTILMNPLGRESCSAEASTIFASHLHSTTIESVGVILYPCPFSTVLVRTWIFAPAQCGVRSFFGIAGL